jgi:hypothetical protein
MRFNLVGFLSIFVFSFPVRLLGLCLLSGDVRGGGGRPCTVCTVPFGQLL